MILLKKILLGLIVVVILAIGAGFLLPRTMHIARSTSIGAPPANVFALVNSYKRFNEWSPWVDVDPAARYTFEGPEAGVGATMSWDGPKAGKGTQTIVASTPYASVANELDFGAQGKARNSWQLEPEGHGTRVTWSFDVDLGGNPFSRYMGILMKKAMEGFYDQGLSGLKRIAEQLPKADLAGFEASVVEVKPVPIAFIEARSSTVGNEIAAVIGASYAKVGAFLKKHKLAQAGPPLTIDTKFDATGYVFEAAVPIDRRPDGEIPADSEVKVKETWSGRAIRTVHKGPYSGMAAVYPKLYAWAAARSAVPAGPPWDEYISDPGNTPEAELTTNIYLPIK